MARHPHYHKLRPQLTPTDPPERHRHSTSIVHVHRERSKLSHRNRHQRHPCNLRFGRDPYRGLHRPCGPDLCICRPGALRDLFHPAIDPHPCRFRTKLNGHDQHHHHPASSPGTPPQQHAPLHPATRSHAPLEKEPHPAPASHPHAPRLVLHCVCDHLSRMCRRRTSQDLKRPVHAARHLPVPGHCDLH